MESYVVLEASCNPNPRAVPNAWFAIPVIS
jgi:hypothetical protein